MLYLPASASLLGAFVPKLVGDVATTAGTAAIATTAVTVNKWIIVRQIKQIMRRIKTSHLGVFLNIVINNVIG